jgi:hypothetical protein
MAPLIYYYARWRGTLKYPAMLGEHLIRYATENYCFVN